MLRLFNRLLLAVVVFLFLLLTIFFLRNVIAPSSGTLVSTSGLMQAEFEEMIGFLDSQQGNQLIYVTAALPLVLIAGFSDAIGHAVILFANRVKPERFAVTIVFNAMLFILGYLIWVGMVALISFVVFDRETAILRAAFAVGVSYLPLVYSFLIALPYIGVFIANIIYFVAALALINSLQIYFPYTLNEAILCAAISFAAVIVFRLTIGRPIFWLRGKLLNAVAGADIVRDVNKALAAVIDRRIRS